MARRGRAYWQKAVDKFERTNLSQEAFCDAHGLTAGTFRWWLYRLRRERSASKPAFVEVVPRATSTTRDACVVVVGRTEVRFGVVPDALYLGALLRAAAGEPQ